MQTVTVVCVGNLKEGYWKDAAAEYQKRLGAFCKLLVVEIEEERLPQKPSLAQIAAGMKEEGRRILSRIPAGSFVIALCIEGKPQSSEELAGLLEQVAAHLEERREIAVDVQVKAPEVRTVDVSVQVAARPGADFNTVRQAVESAVRGWFDGRLLGQSVLRAQLGALIFGVEGVENYALTAPAADVAAAVDELPQLGTLTVAALEGTA